MSSSRSGTIRGLLLGRSYRKVHLRRTSSLCHLRRMSGLNSRIVSSSRLPVALANPLPDVFEAFLDGDQVRLFLSRFATYNDFKSQHLLTVTLARYFQISEEAAIVLRPNKRF